MLKLIRKLNHVNGWSVFSQPSLNISYVQGQEPKPGIREYFYYIDHQGQLFLDDAKVKNFITCFKENDFLNFFFHRLKENKTGKYEIEFPYLSLCGRERNYIRCDDVPIVYHKIINQDYKYYLAYGGTTDKLTMLFEPEKLCMLNNGRVYHPANDRGGGIGLIKSSLAIDISPYFKYDTNSNMPSHFYWNNKKFILTYELYHRYSLGNKD